MAVGVHRDADGAVPEAFLHDLGVLAQHQEEGRGAVPQIVEADRRQTGARDERSERALDDVLPFQGLAGVVRKDEVEVVP